ncbi:MAG: hypothetical protein RJB47_1071 [Pseudomonadota bacterium]|jgi:hypothetical protein
MSTQIIREIQIQLPQDKVWAKLADFGNICHGHPAVKKSFITSAQKTGVGATRHCDLTMMGATAEERVIEWTEGQSITIEIYELHNMPGIDKLTLQLSARSVTGGTVMRGEMNYTMKNWFFDIMNSVMMKSMNAKLLDGIMAGHKKYMETGEIVNEKTPLDLSQVVRLAST